MQNQPKLNWRKSRKDGSLCQYQAAVSSNLAPFLHSTIENNDISEVENVIQTVVSILHEAASTSIPVFSRKKKVDYFIHDESLKQICQDSKSAWRSWCEAGRPRSGSVYQQQMKDARNEVKSYVRKCRAKAERKLIQAKDDMFKTKDERRFNIYQKKTQCGKLVVNGASITDEEELLECWKKSFLRSGSNSNVRNR